MLPNVQRELSTPVSQFVSVASCPVTGHQAKSLALSSLHPPIRDPLCRVKWELQGWKASGKTNLWEIQTSRALTEWQSSTAMWAHPTLLTWMHFKSHLWMHDCTCQDKHTCTSVKYKAQQQQPRALPRKTGFFSEKKHTRSSYVIWELWVGELPRKPAAPVPNYLLFISVSVQKEVWFMGNNYKMKHGNMGWMMINGSHDMCLQKCKRAQTSRRGRLTWVDTRGFAYE